MSLKFNKTMFYFKYRDVFFHKDEIMDEVRRLRIELLLIEIFN